jgi:hypothetical protein
MEENDGSDPASLEEDPESGDRPRSGPSGDHDLLAHPRRRRVLDLLLAHGGRMEPSDLADGLAAAEHGTAIDGRSNDRAKLVRLDLRHSHGPKLAEANVVEYDGESDAIELVDGTRAERLLERRTDVHERRLR